jgi:hypothetical protein
MRIKERNSQRIEQCMRSGKVRVLFNSLPAEFKPQSVVLEVWIFAGGTPPYDFLKKIGVGFGMRDLTAEAGNEAKHGRISQRPNGGSRGRRLAPCGADIRVRGF